MRVLYLSTLISKGFWKTLSSISKSMFSNCEIQYSRSLKWLYFEEYHFCNSSMIIFPPVTDYSRFDARDYGSRKRHLERSWQQLQKYSFWIFKTFKTKPVYTQNPEPSESLDYWITIEQSILKSDQGSQEFTKYMEGKGPFPSHNFRKCTSS